MTRFLFFFVLVMSQLAIGQSTGTINGRLTDTNNADEPLMLAHIRLKDTPIKEQTNFHGKFEINNLEPGTYIVQLNYLGYEPKEISVQVKANEFAMIEVSLTPLSIATENLNLTEVSQPLGKVADKGARR